jgi:hypothetical protein
MSDPKPVEGVTDQTPSTDERLPASPPESARLPWSAPTLTDFGAVSDVTKGISYTPNDGLSNRCI